MEQKINLRGDQYNLKWSSYSSNLIELIREKQQNESYVDVTFFCEGCFIKAHKIILSSFSVVFEEMFKIHDVPHPYIILNGVRLKDFNSIMEFIYNGEVRVYDSDLQAVLGLGEMLKISGLSSVKIKEKTKPPSIPAEPPREFKYAANNSNSASPSNIKVEKPVESVKVSEKIHHKSTNSAIPLAYPEMKISSNNNSPNSRVERLQAAPSTNTISIPMPGLISLSSKFEEVASQEAPPKKRKVVPSIEKNVEKPEKGEKVVFDNKIPKPPNAFMLFSYEWRKKLAVENPNETMKGISIKLSNMWKSLTQEDKDIYVKQAQKVEEEHKKKYPNIHFPVQSTANPSNGVDQKLSLKRKNSNALEDVTSPMVTIDITEELAEDNAPKE